MSRTTAAILLGATMLLVDDVLERWGDVAAQQGPQASTAALTGTVGSPREPAWKACSFLRGGKARPGPSPS